MLKQTEIWRVRCVPTLGFLQGIHLIISVHPDSRDRSCNLPHDRQGEVPLRSPKVFLEGVHRKIPWQIHPYIRGHTQVQLLQMFFFFFCSKSFIATSVATF